MMGGEDDFLEAAYEDRNGGAFELPSTLDDLLDEMTEREYDDEDEADWSGDE